MSDPCFHMGCVKDPRSDECQECGRYTGAKRQITHAPQPEARWMEMALEIWRRDENTIAAVNPRTLVDDIAEALAQVAAEAREAALEEAAGVLGDHEQGLLELVNSGDARIYEVRGELKKLQAIARDISALKSPSKEPK